MFGRTSSISNELEAPLETQMGVVLTTPPRHCPHKSINRVLTTVCTLLWLISACAYECEYPLLHVTRRVPNGTIVVVPGLWLMNHAIVSEVLYLCYWHSQESSLPVQDSLRTTSGTWPTCMSVYTCILPSVCVLLYICCCFLHALWASQIIPLTLTLSGKQISA